MLLVSGVQQSDSYIHIYVYIYSFSDSFLLYVIKNSEYSSLCCTVGPSCLSVLYIGVV